jgi:hypothetical protein
MAATQLNTKPTIAAAALAASMVHKCEIKGKNDRNWQERVGKYCPHWSKDSKGR